MKTQKTPKHQGNPVQERENSEVLCGCFPCMQQSLLEEGGRRATRKAKMPTGFTRTFPEVAEATAAGRNKVPQWHIRLQATQTQHAVPMCEWGSSVMQLPESPIFLWATDLTQSPVSDPRDLSGSLIWT